jgi:hypothetical protein
LKMCTVVLETKKMEANLNFEGTTPL